MSEEIKIEEGKTYIFKGRKAINSKSYYKFKIVEETKTTYLIENLDKNGIFRNGIDDFIYDYKPIEVIGNRNINTKDLIKS